MSLHRDADVCKLIKGNDEFSYMYVVERRTGNFATNACNQSNRNGWCEGYGVQEKDIRSCAAVVTT